MKITLANYPKSGVSPKMPNAGIRPGVILPPVGVEKRIAGNVADNKQGKWFRSLPILI